MFGIFRPQNASKARQKAREHSAVADAPSDLYRVKVALNGVPGDDVDISVSGFVVSVKSKTQNTAERPVVERYFRMPREIDEEDIERFVKDDILVIELQPKPIQIEILED